MNIDKNYFLTRLANGEDMDAIGQEVADMMNAAVQEHQAKLQAEQEAKAREAALAEQEAAKRDLIEEMVEIIQELAILEGMDPNDIALSDDEIDGLVAAFSEMFRAMRELKNMAQHFEKMSAAVPVPTPVQADKIMPTDEQILADFLKRFN